MNKKTITVTEDELNEWEKQIIAEVDEEWRTGRMDEGFLMGTVIGLGLFPILYLIVLIAQDYLSK